MTSADAYNQMQAVMNEYAKMSPVATNDIAADLKSRVKYFEPQYNELRGQEAAAYAAPAQLMQQYTQAYPQGGYGPSALGMLNSILGNIGQQQGRTNVLRDVIGQQSGRLEDMARTIADQYNQKQNSLLQRYQMLTDPWKAALSQEEEARNRAFQREQNALSRGQANAAAAAQIEAYRKIQEANANKYGTLTPFVPDTRTASSNILGMLGYGAGRLTDMASRLINR